MRTGNAPDRLRRRHPLRLDDLAAVCLRSLNERGHVVDDKAQVTEPCMLLLVSALVLEVFVFRAVTLWRRMSVRWSQPRVEDSIRG